MESSKNPIPTHEANLLPRYVLVTAAHNEEAFIHKTIASVISQTLRPVCWVIVDDGSTDRTAAIVRAYLPTYDFIHLLPLRRLHPPDFAAQVHAIRAGCDFLQNLDYNFIANIDADIAVEPTYFNDLIGEFQKDPTLGLAGGFLHEAQAGVFTPRRGNRTHSVPHALQLFRRECFEAIRGYVPLKYGAPDWYAEIETRRNGWRVQSFVHLRAFHHRATGKATGRIRYMYRAGLASCHLGSHPVFELMKCVRRVRERPFFLAALARLTGVAVGLCRGETRSVSPDFVQFLRNEQKARLSALFVAHRN